MHISPNVAEYETYQFPSAPTSLDALETNAHPLLSNTEAQQWIHAKCENERTALIVALSGSADYPMQKRAARIAECCKWPIFFVRSDGSPSMSLQRCRDRLCPTCSKIQSRHTAAKVLDHVQHMDAPRFLTLTVQNDGRTLKQCTDHLVESFRRLRRQNDWKDRVDGGIWTIEIKQGKRQGTWHVHLHMLIDGRYYDQAALSDAWLQATGDSTIVHITKVNSAKNAANYIAKYVAKPGDFAKFAAEEIIDFASAMKGRRLLGTFGTAHALRIEAAEETEPAPTETARISANKVRMLESLGFVPAMTACEILQRCGGFWAAAIGRSKPLDAEKPSPADLIVLGELISACALHVECMNHEQTDHATAADSAKIEEPDVYQLSLTEDWLASPYR